MSNTNKDRKKAFDFENYERPSFFRRVQLRWEHKWRFMPTKIKYGIENIISWFKIIWNDRSWSPNYFYYILIHKIQTLETDIENYSHFVSREDSLKYLVICKELLKRVSDEYYFSEWHEYYKSEFYEVPFTVPNGLDKTDFGFHEEDDLSQFVEIESEVVMDNLDEYFEKYPRELGNVLDEHPDYDITDPERRGTIALKVAIRMHKKAKGITFKILEDKIDHWWI